MSDLFGGAARELPEAPSSGGSLGFGFGYSFRTDEYVPPEPVRHASGYAPFVALAESLGADPEVLAADLDALVAFVRAHAEALAEPALVEAGAVFLGNALIAAYPRADWRARPEPEVGSRAFSMPVRSAFESIRDDPAFGSRMAAGLPGRWAEEDARWDEVDAGIAATEATSAAAALQDVPEFERPFIDVGPFLDEHGEPILYGSRWRYPDGPPDDAYSRVTHPERFAPLIDVAEALVAFLEREYDVAVEREGRRITLRPRVGAPIRIELSDFPALHLSAGLLLRDTLPDCGCDACDETAASEVHALERTVLGVVAGGFTERAPEGPGTGAYHLRDPDGGGRGSGGSDVPEDALVAPEVVVAQDGTAWPAWPRRR